MSSKVKWIDVCELTKIYPATGVCALVNGKQIALFRPYDDEQVFALDNMDPFGQANVLSRGLICEHQEQLWVASPLKKQHFRLSDGVCLESEQHPIKSYAVRVNQGRIQVEA